MEDASTLHLPEELTTLEQATPEDLYILRRQMEQYTRIETHHFDRLRRIEQRTRRIHQRLAETLTNISEDDILDDDYIGGIMHSIGHVLPDYFPALPSPLEDSATQALIHLQQALALQDSPVIVQDPSSDEPQRIAMLETAIQEAQNIIASLISARLPFGSQNAFIELLTQEIISAEHQIIHGKVFFGNLSENIYDKEYKFPFTKYHQLEEAISNLDTFIQNYETSAEEDIYQAVVHAQHILQDEQDRDILQEMMSTLEQRVQTIQQMFLADIFFG